MREDNVIRRYSKKINKLDRKIKSLKICINHKKLYNLFINSSIVLERCFPFILSASIIGSCNTNLNNLTTKNQLPNKIVSENTFSRSDSSIKFTYSDIINDSNDKIIEYSTKWNMDADGFYYRDSWIYNTIDEIEIYDKDKLLSMNREELEKIVSIKKKERIVKEVLLPEDKLYDEDGLYIRVVNMDDYRKDILYKVVYIFNILLFGSINRSIIQFINKDRVKNYLVSKKEFLNSITEDDIVLFENILDYELDNLDVLYDNNLNKDRYVKSLRKTR